MLFYDLKGRQRDVNLNRYLIDWDRKVSGPQKAVKDFLRPYWGHKRVCEELRVPYSKLRLDLVCVTDQLIVEVDGEQHEIYNPWMHRSLNGYAAAQKRDLEKERFAEVNGFRLIHIKDDEIKRGLLSRDWIKETFGVEL